MLFLTLYLFVEAETEEWGETVSDSERQREGPGFCGREYIGSSSSLGRSSRLLRQSHVDEARVLYS